MDAMQSLTWIPLPLQPNIHERQQSNWQAFTKQQLVPRRYGSSTSSAVAASAGNGGYALPTSLLVSMLAGACMCGAKTKSSRRSRRSAVKAVATTKKEEQAAVIEGAILQLFQDEEPSIYKVRDCLASLGKLVKKPNTSVAGDWIIFWASREGSVDKVFGPGVTKDWWLQMPEYLIRFSTKQGGRVVEAAEVIRKVGPFPNQSNSLKGVYSVAGTNGLQIKYNKIQTDEEEDLPIPGGGEEMVIDVDVIYSSKTMLALQWQDTSGECDFFVLTPVEDTQRELDKLTGAERARFFFN